LDDGEYYIYAKIDDGFHTPYYNYSSGPLTILHIIENDPPSISILEPDGVQDKADKFYVIKWSDDDPDDNAIIKLYYTPVQDYSKGQYVEGAHSIQEDDDKADDFYLWDTTEIAEGKYYIYALITDNKNSISKAISKGPITVDHNKIDDGNIEPFIEITEPDGIKDVANATYTIKWVDYDPDNDALITLYYDNDTVHDYNGTMILSLISEDGQNDELLWHTSTYESGDYYIYAVIDDGYHDPIYSEYSRGPVTIDHLTKDINIIDPPKAKIMSPLTNSKYNADDEIQFDATGTEGGEGLSFLWTSDRDGTLGDTYNFRTKLSAGEHQITLFVLDDNGQSDSTTIIVHVSGEDDEEDDQEIVKGLDDWMVYGFIAIIIILILIIVLAAVVGSGSKKSKKDDEEDKDKEKPKKGKPSGKPKSGEKTAGSSKSKPGVKKK
jgi:hypothetical protein